MFELIPIISPLVTLTLQPFQWSLKHVDLGGKMHHLLYFYLFIYFLINFILIISCLLNGFHGCDFRTSLRRTVNEFIVLIIMSGSPGWKIWSVKCSLILERSRQTSLTRSITQSPHIIDLAAPSCAVKFPPVFSWRKIFPIFWWSYLCSSILSQRGGVFAGSPFLCLLKDKV